jgi:hypothetical protein
VSAGEQLDAPYQEVADVKTVGRGIGIWGDMVVTLKNSDKIELRSLPKCDHLVTSTFSRLDSAICIDVRKGLLPSHTAARCK